MIKVLDVFWKEDIQEMLFWRVDAGVATFYAKCSDEFFWGTADVEKITKENLHELELAVIDILAFEIDVEFAPVLFAAKVRKMRPQHAVYTDNPALWDLYDACGPEREPGMGNPHKHPRLR
jgi:hypothetical protein